MLCSIEEVKVWKVQVLGFPSAFFLLPDCAVVEFLPWSPPSHTPQGKFCDSAFCRAMAFAVTGRKVKQNRGRAAVDITEGSDISPFKWGEKEEC